MRPLISWLRGPNEPEVHLTPEQQSRFDDSYWRSSNSKWTYIVWFSLGLYAGFALLVQGARAGSKSVLRLGLIHLAMFAVLLPLAVIGSESYDLLMLVSAPISLVACASGVIFTSWANPTILRWKAKRLVIVSAPIQGTPASNLENPNSNGDLRVDGSSSGPRRLDI